MRRILSTATLLWVPAAISVCLVVASSGTAAAKPRTTALVYEVTSTGASAEQARRLAAALGLDAALRESDGSLEYTDGGRFLAAPTLAVEAEGRDEHGRATVGRAFDAEALGQLRTLPDREALKRVRNALKAAGLLPAGADANVGHSRLTLYDSERRVVAAAALDTSVGFHESLGGIPVRGPGAKLQVSLDGDGTVTHLRYARREVRPAKAVRILTPEQARQGCAERYGPSAARAELTTELVYHAPPLSLGSVRRIVPHYVCGGTLPSGAELAQLMLPAVQDAPRVELSVDVSPTRDGSTVRAHATAAGGRPPYTYGWGSSHTPLDPVARVAGPDISYEPTGTNTSARERVSVVVTDADGLTAASASINDVVLTLSGDTEPTSAPTVGLEWLFGLDEAYGFWGAATHPATGIVGSFNKGPDEMRERDFKDPAFGGQDTAWADAVDLEYYTGHANGSGWVMQTEQDDNEPATSLVDAWAVSAIEAQSGDIEYAAMGPAFPKLVLTGPGQQQPKIVWVSNYDDYFWDRGPTTGDIGLPLGFWVLQAPVD